MITIKHLSNISHGLLFTFCLTVFISGIDALSKQLEDGRHGAALVTGSVMIVAAVIGSSSGYVSIQKRLAD